MGSKLKSRFLLVENNVPVKGRNAADTADIDLFQVSTAGNFEFLLVPRHSGSPIATESYVGTQLGSYIPSSQKGAANGVAELDAGGKIPSAQLPPIAITDTFVVASEAAQEALTAEVGDVAVRTDLNKSFILRVAPASSFANWQELLTPGAPVQSVNGQTGTVSLDTDDIAEAGNLYFTTSRARTAAVVNSTAGTETDQAASVAAMKSYVTTAIGAIPPAVTPGQEVITVVAGDITNGYIDLAEEAIVGSLHIHPDGGIPATPVTDFTVTIEALVTRVTFTAGYLAAVGATNKIVFTYLY